MRLLDISRWPWFLVFLLAGLDAVFFAFLTVNLFSQAMASLDFLTSFGWTAVEYGGLVQAAELIFFGAVALFLWLVFKACEGELVFRYRRWCRARRLRRGDDN